MSSRSGASRPRERRSANPDPRQGAGRDWFADDLRSLGIAALETAAADSGFDAHLSIGPSAQRRLPLTGVWSDAARPDGDTIAELRPSFVAIDVTLDGNGLHRLVGWLNLAEATNTDLVARLSVRGRLSALEPLLAQFSRSRRARMLILVDDGETLPPARLARAVREAAARDRPELGVAIGTRGHFADLNRSWPRAVTFDDVAFPLDPLTHSDDGLSLIENLAALPAMIATAQHRGNGVSVHVVPVASGAGRAAVWETLGSAWTMASLLALAWAGASSVAYDGALAPVESGTRGSGIWAGSPSGASGWPHSPTHRTLQICRDLGTRRLVPILGTLGLPIVASGLETPSERAIILVNLSAVPARLSIGPLRDGWRHLGSPDEIRFVAPGEADTPMRSLRSRANAVSMELAGYGLAVLKSMTPA